MARRAGKAASRKARQRYVPKTPRPAPPPAPEAAASEAVEATVRREVASADQPRRTAPIAYGSGGSTLSLRERAEYHYVERDLRNIGVLSLVMAVLLVGAYFLFNALGLIA
jgi:hypothetical protein